jgi:hypothetical protein
MYMYVYWVYYSSQSGGGTSSLWGSGFGAGGGLKVFSLLFFPSKYNSPLIYWINLQVARQLYGEVVLELGGACSWRAR